MNLKIYLLASLLISASNSFAIVSLHNPATQPGTIVASEAIINNTSLIQSKSNETSIETKYLWSLTPESTDDFYVRLDLENASFSSSLDPEMITDDAASTFRIISGGAEGANHLIIAVTPSGFIDVEPHIIIDFGMDFTGSNSNLLLEGQSEVYAGYSVYQTEEEAMASNNAIASSKGKLVEFKNALLINGGKSNKAKLLDKSTGSVRFIGNEAPCVEKNSSMCSPIMNITLDKSIYKTAAPTDLGHILDFIDIIETANLYMYGDFSPVSQVYVDNTNFDCSTNDLSAEIDDSRQAANLNITQNIKEEAVVCIEVNGQTPIAEGHYTAELIINTYPGFHVKNRDFSGDTLR